MKKVLIINTIGMGFEGISSVIFNYLENMNKNDLDIHIISFDGTRPEIISKIESIGTLHIFPERKHQLCNYLITLNKLLNQQFDIIHIHGNSGTMLFEVILAKLNKIQKILVHCHNTQTDHPLINKVLKKPMIYLSNNLLACSNSAGKWLYDNHPYIVLNNAIDIKKFSFNEDKREKIRKIYKIKSNDVVIGHIGHFTKQKNHTFLIDIFNEFLKFGINAKLLLVSDGPLYEDIKKKVYSLKISDNVIFTGRRDDIQDIYNAMDIFVIPSLWEGLPLVMLEAQANGLQVLASDVISKEVKCTDNVKFISLNDSPEVWAKYLFEMIQNNNVCLRNQSVNEIIKENGFDIELEADKLKSIYLNKL